MKQNREIMAKQSSIQKNVNRKKTIKDENIVNLSPTGVKIDFIFLFANTIGIIKTNNIRSFIKLS